MKVLLLLFLFSLSIHAQENCHQSGNQGNVDELVKECTKILSQDLKEDSLEAALAASGLFLQHNQKRTDFDIKAAKALLERILPFSDKASDKDKSRIYLQASGIHGRISDKLRSNGGAGHAKEAINYLKKSLHHDKNNQSAAKAFATTISAFTDKAWVTRKFIETGLGIEIDKEVKAALKYLEVAGLKSDPLYKKLKAF